MGGPIRAIIKPELLIWARKSAHYQIPEAARKANVSVERLAEWESGTSSPTINQLRTLANVYKRPLAVFYLPEPPRQFDAMRDFRRLPNAAAVEYSPELALAVRRARFRRETAVELARELEVETPRLDFDPHRYTGDPNGFAEAARKLLAVSFDEQFGWTNQYEALNGWSGAVERLGFLVFQTGGISIREMRGFSIHEAVYPVIVVNAKDSPRGRIFTILHELAHILSHTGGICDTHETAEAQDIEVFCNRVAGSILVPESALLEAIRSMMQVLKKGTIPDAELTILAQRFAVSQEVILRRLLSLGRISLSFYRERREELQKAYDRERDQGEGFARHHQLVIRDLGKQYIRVVLDAYYQEAITSSDVSDYLGIRLKHLHKIEHAVFRGISA